MGILDALARAEAAATGRAQPIATVRHVHLTERPLVLVPLAMAGEAAAPLAVMLGCDRERPRVLVVPQPRDRDLRRAFMSELAAAIAAELGMAGLGAAGSAADENAVEAGVASRPGALRGRVGGPEAEGASGAVSVGDAGASGEAAAAPAPGDGAVDGFAAAEPQLVVPNVAGIEFLGLLGRATRFQEGDQVGRWLTFFADRAQMPGSASLIAATRALGLHWATGQSAVEDANLASLLAWLDGGDPVAAERQAAGPQTDPEFDNQVLSPLIADYDDGWPGAADRITEALTGQLAGTWQQVWRALDAVRELPEAPSAADRWTWDVMAYAGFMTDPLPQPRSEGPIAAAARLDRLERAQARYEVQRAFDDPLVMAGYELTGDAFRCTVLAVERDRKEGRKLRPRITVDLASPVQKNGPWTSPARRGQTAELEEADGGVAVFVLAGGMGRGSAPAEGSVPEVGEQLVYTTLSDSFQRSATFPEDVPWTHGGGAADAG